MEKEEKILRIKNIPARLREVGKIKIGYLGEMRKSRAGKDYRLPKKLEHFRVCFPNKDEGGNFILDQEYHDLIGEKEPTRLNIFFAYNNVYLNFPTFYGLYVGKQCVCRGDGESAVRLDRESGKKFEVDCPCEYYGHTDKGKPKCKMHGLLNCTLAEYKSQGGFHVFRTTSFYSIQGILSSLESFAVKSQGWLIGIPFQLVISSKTVSPAGAGIKTVYVTHIEFSGTELEFLQYIQKTRQHYLSASQEIKKLENRANQLLLAEGIPETEEDIQDVQNEFVPENVDQQEHAEGFEEREGDIGPDKKYGYDEDTRTEVEKMMEGEKTMEKLGLAATAPQAEKAMKELGIEEPVPQAKKEKPAKAFSEKTKPVEQPPRRRGFAEEPRDPDEQASGNDEEIPFV